MDMNTSWVAYATHDVGMRSIITVVVIALAVLAVMHMIGLFVLPDFSNEYQEWRNS